MSNDVTVSPAKGSGEDHMLTVRRSVPFDEFGLYMGPATSPIWRDGETLHAIREMVDFARQTAPLAPCPPIGQVLARSRFIVFVAVMSDTIMVAVPSTLTEHELSVLKVVLKIQVEQHQARHRPRPSTTGRPDTTAPRKPAAERRNDDPLDDMIDAVADTVSSVFKALNLRDWF